MDNKDNKENKEENKNYTPHEELLKECCDLVNQYQHDEKFKQRLKQNKRDVENLKKEFDKVYKDVPNDDPEKWMAMQMLSRLGVDIMLSKEEVEEQERKFQERKEKRKKEREAREEEEFKKKLDEVLG